MAIHVKVSQWITLGFSLILLNSMVNYLAIRRSTSPTLAKCSSVRYIAPSIFGFPHSAPNDQEKFVPICYPHYWGTDSDISDLNLEKTPVKSGIFYQILYRIHRLLFSSRMVAISNTRYVDFKLPTVISPYDFMDRVLLNPSQKDSMCLQLDTHSIGEEIYRPEGVGRTNVTGDICGSSPTFLRLEEMKQCDFMFQVAKTEKERSPLRPWQIVAATIYIVLASFSWIVWLFCGPTDYLAGIAAVVLGMTSLQGATYLVEALGMGIHLYGRMPIAVVPLTTLIRWGFQNPLLRVIFDAARHPLWIESQRTVQSEGDKSVETKATETADTSPYSIVSNQPPSPTLPPISDLNTLDDHGPLRNRDRENRTKVNSGETTHDIHLPPSNDATSLRRRAAAHNLSVHTEEHNIVKEGREMTKKSNIQKSHETANSEDSSEKHFDSEHERKYSDAIISSIHSILSSSNISSPEVSTTSKQLEKSGNDTSANSPLPQENMPISYSSIMLNIIIPTESIVIHLVSAIIAGGAILIPSKLTSQLSFLLAYIVIQLWGRDFANMFKSGFSTWSREGHIPDQISKASKSETESPRYVCHNRNAVSSNLLEIYRERVSRKLKGTSPNLSDLESSETPLPSGADQIMNLNMVSEALHSVVQYALRPLHDLRYDPVSFRFKPSGKKSSEASSRNREKMDVGSYDMSGFPLHKSLRRNELNLQIQEDELRARDFQNEQENIYENPSDSESDSFYSSGSSMTSPDRNQMSLFPTVTQPQNRRIGEVLSEPQRPLSHERNPRHHRPRNQSEIRVSRGLRRILRVLRMRGWRAALTDARLQVSRSMLISKVMCLRLLVRVHVRVHRWSPLAADLLYVVFRRLGELRDRLVGPRTVGFGAAPEQELEPEEQSPGHRRRDSKPISPATFRRRQAAQLDGRDAQTRLVRHISGSSVSPMEAGSPVLSSPDMDPAYCLRYGRFTVDSTVPNSGDSSYGGSGSSSSSSSHFASDNSPQRPRTRSAHAPHLSQQPDGNSPALSATSVSRMGSSPVPGFSMESSGSTGRRTHQRVSAPIHAVAHLVSVFTRATVVLQTVQLARVGILAWLPLKMHSSNLGGSDEFGLSLQFLNATAPVTHGIAQDWLPSMARLALLIDLLQLWTEALLFSLMPFFLLMLRARSTMELQMRAQLRAQLAATRGATERAASDQRRFLGNIFAEIRGPLCASQAALEQVVSMITLTANANAPLYTPTAPSTPTGFNSPGTVNSGGKARLRGVPGPHVQPQDLLYSHLAQIAQNRPISGGQQTAEATGVADSGAPEKKLLESPTPAKQAQEKEKQEDTSWTFFPNNPPKNPRLQSVQAASTQSVSTPRAIMAVRSSVGEAVKEAQKDSKTSGAVPGAASSGASVLCDPAPLLAAALEARAHAESVNVILTNALQLSALESNAFHMSAVAFRLPSALREVETQLRPWASFARTRLHVLVAQNLPEVVRADCSKLVLVVANLAAHGLRIASRFSGPGAAPGQSSSQEMELGEVRVFAAALGFFQGSLRTPPKGSAPILSSLFASSDAGRVEGSPSSAKPWWRDAEGGAHKFLLPLKDEGLAKESGISPQDSPQQDTASELFHEVILQELGSQGAGEDAASSTPTPKGANRGSAEKRKIAEETLYTHPPSEPMAWTPAQFLGLHLPELPLPRPQQLTCVLRIEIIVPLPPGAAPTKEEAQSLFEPFAELKNRLRRREQSTTNPAAPSTPGMYSGRLESSRGVAAEAAENGIGLAVTNEIARRLGGALGAAPLSGAFSLSGGEPPHARHRERVSIEIPTADNETENEKEIENEKDQQQSFENENEEERHGRSTSVGTRAGAQRLKEIEDSRRRFGDGKITDDVRTDKDFPVDHPVHISLSHTGLCLWFEVPVEVSSLAVAKSILADEKGRNGIVGAPTGAQGPLGTHSAVLGGSPGQEAPPPQNSRTAMFEAEYGYPYSYSSLQPMKDIGVRRLQEELRAAPLAANAVVPHMTSPRPTTTSRFMPRLQTSLGSESRPAIFSPRSGRTPSPRGTSRFTVKKVRVGRKIFDLSKNYESQK